MPLSFHTRLTDTQVAAIDAATRIVDPRTGLLLTVSRQEVVSSILDAWIAQHAPPSADEVALLDRLMDDDAPLLETLLDNEAPRLDALLASTLDVQPEVSLADIGPPRSDQAAVKLALAERVRALRRQGMSYPKIVTQFEAEQVPTLSGRGHWSNSSVVKLETFGL